MILVPAVIAVATPPEAPLGAMDSNGATAVAATSSSTICTCRIFAENSHMLGSGTQSLTTIPLVMQWLSLNDTPVQIGSSEQYSKQRCRSVGWWLSRSPPLQSVSGCTAAYTYEIICSVGEGSRAARDLAGVEYPSPSGAAVFDATAGARFVGASMITSTILCLAQNTHSL